MKRFFLIPLILVWLSCNNQQKHSDEKRVDSGVHNPLIVGVWAENEDENAIFSIEKDAVFYYETDERVDYKLSNDSLIIFYDGYTAINIVEKLSEDSLVFITEVGYINRLIRRK